MFRKITLYTLVLALIVLVLSAYVRSSAIGLGCPDWPTCYGQALVSGDMESITQAQESFPNSPFNLIRAWKEMAYRYLVGLLGILVLFLTLLSYFQKRCRVVAITSTTVLLGLVCLQAAFGMWTVTMQGMPIIVTGHFILGLMTFWLLFWFYLRINPKVIISHHSKQAGPIALTRFAMVILLAQIILGIWTSTNFAALSCLGFPRCNGEWMPAVDYLSALNLFAGLNSGYSGVLSYDGQVAIHWIHRVGAIISFTVLTLVMLRATSDYYPRPLRKAGLLLSILLLVQILLGFFSVELELPLLIAVAHSVVATLLMLPLIVISFYSKYTSVDALERIEKVELLNKSDVDVVVATDEAKDIYLKPTTESLLLRLKTQLKKTRSGLGHVFSSISLAQKEINADLLEQIESGLLMADIGIEVSTEIVARLTERLQRHQLNDALALEVALKEILFEILEPCGQSLTIPQQPHPFVILVVGVNGVGKTTTIGKLAKHLQLQGHSVMLAAGDTYRAAAVEQLEVWGERNNIHVVAQQTGADSAAVIYDAVQSAQAKQIDVLIADTAGRLHTKANLMDELSKIKRIMKKIDAAAPHEVLLVLDAGTGQNALSQTKIFNEVVGLTGLALTKLDGTAKGGVIFALAKQFQLPIRFIGVGEGIDDLQNFDAQSFVDALFVKD